MAKERKTINVSLQSKKYLEPVNEILNEWEENSLNLSTQICETLLLASQLKKSSTFLNILTVYELIEKMMNVYNVQDKQQLEQIFSEVISVDNAKLAQLFSQFNGKTQTVSSVSEQIAKNNVIEKNEETVTIEPEEKKPQIVEKEIVVTREEKPMPAQTVKPEKVEIPEIQEMQEDDELNIPIDFLLNS